MDERKAIGRKAIRRKVILVISVIKYILLEIGLHHIHGGSETRRYVPNVWIKFSEPKESIE